MVTSCCDMDDKRSRFLFLYVLAVFYVFFSKGYEFNFVNPYDCLSESLNGYNYFFDATQLSCVPCNQTSEFQKASIDGLKCVCQPGFKIKNLVGRYLTCEACPQNQVPSDDGWECVICDGRNITGDHACGDCSQRQIAVERQLSGGYADAGKSKCSPCAENTEPNADKSRCVYCGQLLSIQSGNTQCVCPSENLMDGICYLTSDDISNIPSSKQLARLDYDGMVLESSYFKSHARTAIGQCGKKYQNASACEQLGNMCTLTMYDTSQNTVCGSYLNMILQSSSRKERPSNMPWLFYENKPSVVLSSLELTETYQFPDSRLNIILAVYHINGSFLGFWNAEDGHLQLCKNTNSHMQAAYLFGTTYEQQCRVKVDELYDPEVHPPLLFDIYIKQASAGKIQLIDVPAVPINLQSWREDPSKKSLNLDSWQLVRRIFLVDNIVGKQDATTHYVRYAKDIRIVVNLQKDSLDGLIYPPFIEVTYSSVSLIDKDTFVPVSFSVSYAMDTSKHERDIWISFGVLVALAFIYSIFTTWSWSHRNGQIAIDCWTLIQWFFNLCSSMANAIFIIILMYSLWTTIFFKKQREVVLLPHNGPNNDQYLGLLISAFILKFLHLLHLFVWQINVDVFLVDWEKPSRVEVSKTASNEASRKLITEDYHIPSPSVWRMYLVANEWNEIQSYRKLNPAIQLTFTLFFLEVVGFGNIATMDPHSNLKLTDNDKYFAPQSHIMRFALIGIVYFSVAFVQLLLVSLCYERFIEDKIQQFVDLCSTCNISVFIFSTELYGFYIHGRCIHGKSDVGLRQMHENFIKEERDLVCKRGLVADDDQQTFEIIIPRKLRSNINKVTKPVLYAQNSRSLSTDRGLRQNLYECIEAHYAINHLLTSFIDHTLTDVDYIVKKKSLIESILQAEFQPHSNIGSFYRDNGHNAFESVLFYGNEITLAIFEVLLFSCIDILFSSYVLDGLATFFFMEVILATLRDSFGKVNLARKTMVDNRFLI